MKGNFVIALHEARHARPLRIHTHPHPHGRAHEETKVTRYKKNPISLGLGWGHTMHVYALSSGDVKTRARVQDIKGTTL